ncbi:MAG: hypothetical protein K9M99_11975 [Candidatus Cloacimonetes bacterium]|nr:hypothetical protein [Candidatus Cloacimonadota bacterium]
MMILVCLPLLLSAAKNQDFTYEFHQGADSCTFKGDFIIKAVPDSLLKIVFDFNHIVDYALTAKSLELVQQGENWYDVAFIYQDMLVLENQSVWRRTINRAEKIITFKMISTSNNMSVIPELLSSSGYYQFKPANDGCLVEFFQEFRLSPGLLNEAYYRKAEKEGIKFLRVFKDFLEQCSKISKE